MNSHAMNPTLTRTARWLHPLRPARRLLGLAALFAFTAPHSTAETLTFQQGVNGYTGLAQTTLVQTVPTTPNGGLATGTWTVDGGSGAFNDGQFRHALIWFDNIFGGNAGQIPLGSTITSATITANYNDNSNSAFAIYRMLQTWSPATATWDSFTAGVQNNGIEAASTATTTFSNPNNNAIGTYNAYGTSLTADLSLFSAGTPNFGWVVLPTSGNSGWGWTTSGGSPVLAVTFTPPQPLSAAITSPANGATVGASFTISATAVVVPGTVDSVDFYMDDLLKGNDASSPYSWNITGAAQGAHTLKAVANGTGGPATSSTVNITVGNQPPTVAVTSPAAGSVFAVGSNVTLTASATDDATVASVEFFVDNVSVGSDSSSPYSATWSNAPLGFHAVKAVATDNASLSTTSTVVNVNVVTNPGFGALSFDGSNDYVTMGAAPGLGASTFTLECWMRIDGAGIVTNSGTGGVNVAPLIDKGRGEDDGSSIDCNYIFGVQADNKLAADFEDMQSGLNHPIVGTAALSAGTWHHCAITYDGSWWRIYLDGAADASLQVTGGGNVQVPRYDSIQHFALGTAMNSTGTPSGYFKGLMDEVRVWNIARTQAQIAASMYSEIAAATGLIGRWSLNETSGTTANNTGSSAVNGALTNGPVWTTGYPLLPAANQPPTVAITSPANNDTVFTSFTINATAADSDGTVASVTFFDGATQLGIDTTSPFSYAWSGAGIGSHALTAVALDNGGLTTTSAVVNVTVSSNEAPAAPVNLAPANGATGVATTVTPTVSVTDPNGDPMTVTFYGRANATPTPGPDFTVVALPDTQFYAESYPATFQAQTNWIVNNRVARNIVYVTGEGDVANVNSATAQYDVATAAYALLENPVTTGLPQGIPFGVPVGNHDSPYTQFEIYFPPSRFSGRNYYGGCYSTGYRNHYDLFSAGGMDFIVLALEYNAGANSAIMTWANGILQANASRRAIVVTHSLLQAGSNWPTPAAWSTDGGTTIFPALSANPNLFLMLCGHNHGQGRRHEQVGSRYIDVLLADYQSEVNGGDGYLRTMEFSPANNRIGIKTYSPTTGGSKTTVDNEFTLDYTMTSAPPAFTVIGTQTGVASGTETSISWSGLAEGTTYEWYAVASDGSLSTTGATRTFTTQGAPPPKPSVTLGLSGSPLAEAAGVATVTATLSASCTSDVTVNLAFAGTASLTTDYTASANNIVIAAGNTSGSVTLTAVQDSLYENPNETIVVEIDTVTNGTESGTQTVTATITDDDAPPVVTGFTAYNDCSSSAGNPANTTEYQGNGTTTGLLKDFDTGTILPVTLTMSYDICTFDATGGPIPPSPTDAYNTFNGKVVFDDVVHYNTAFSGWWMEARFTGLDPAKDYEFATSVNRGGSGGDYSSRLSKFTITDIDSATQSGTVGVTVNSPTSVTFCSGTNTAGYVARWTTIKCGTDGAFTVRVEDGGGVGKGYGFDGIMLRETGGPPNQAPTVAITSPTEGASVGTAFTIAATAADSDGTISSVAFYDGITLLNTDTSSPYSFAWTGASVGSHALTAVALDNGGLTTTSAVVNVTVSSPPGPGGTLLSQNFSTDPVNYTLPGTSSPFRFYDGPRYWAKSDMSGLTVNASITGSDGPYLGAQNLNDGGFTFTDTSPAQIDFTLPVTGYSNLKLSIALAGLPGAEDINFIRAKTDNDGDGSYETTLFDFKGSGNNAYTDTVLGALTSAFKTFNDIVLPTPTAPDGNLRLRLETFNDTDGFGEATGIDSIVITGSSSGPQPPTVTLGLTGSPLAEAAGTATVTATLSATYTSDVTVNLAFSGTATPTTDYTSSANNMVIAAGNTTGSITLTAVQDSLYENPNETIIVDIASVVNGSESGTQQVTATITDDDPAPVVNYRSFTGTAITENFDGLTATGTAITALTGWDAGNFDPTQANQPGPGNGITTVTDTSLVVDDGTIFLANGTASIGNLGTTGSGDRALGGMPKTASQDLYHQLAIKNDSGSLITSFILSYTGEQWASAPSANADYLSVWFSDNNASSGFVTMGSTFTFTAPQLNLNTKLDGNAAANRTLISGTFTPAAPIAPGNTFYIRWYDRNDTDQDHVLAIDDLTVTPTTASQAPAQYVIVISVDGMGSEYVKPLLTTGLTNELINFKRFQTEGSGTLNARDDADFAVTLPNHVTMMTSRGVNGPTGHNWTGNGDPAPTDTFETNKGSYVASGFDVAHDNGLRTGIWSGKSKFSLFQQSYSLTAGELDSTGTDNGRDKIDYDKVVAGISAASLTTDFTGRMTASPYNYIFFHYQDPDATGHASGWSTDPNSAFAATLKSVDTQIGTIMQMIANNPTLNGKTAIILTADHGGHGTTHGDITNYLDYTIPFYVWAPGVVPAGGDLYAMNPASRTEPGALVNPPYTGGQPVRNGDCANLALDLLGLGAVPGSTIDSAQDLVVTIPAANQPPTVAITSPADSATVGTSFTIDATAADSDGTITSVAFYDGATLLGTDTGSPYSYAWSGASPGSHALTAVALDNGGLTTTSAVVNITVAAPVTPSAIFSGLTASQSIAAGTASVTLGGTASGTGPVYPATGETVAITINGVTRNATISGTAGAFTLVFPTASLPASAVPYPITYGYAGNGTTLKAATDDTTTALTVMDPFVLWIDNNYPALTDKTPAGDPDGDGMDNQAEYAFGLNPSDGSSANPITAQLDPLTGTFSYTRRNPSLTGLGYTVLTSTDMLTWTPDVGGSQTPDSPATAVQTVTVQVGNPAVGGKLFVRVTAE